MKAERTEPMSYAVYVSATGQLVTMTDRLPDPLPEGVAVVSVPAPGPHPRDWSPEARAFVALGGLPAGLFPTIPASAVRAAFLRWCGARGCVQPTPVEWAAFLAEVPLGRLVEPPATGRD